MQWRRGLLLAAIHLAVAGTLIVWQERAVWPHLFASDAPLPKPPAQTANSPDEQTVSFSPCGMWEQIPNNQNVLFMGEMPAVALSGWSVGCSGSFTVASKPGQTWIYNTRLTELENVIVLCALISVQWFFMGGFPLIRPRRWWLEPGALITLLTLAAFALLPIPVVNELSRLPAVLAVFTWLFWFCLLLWKTLGAGWRLTARGIAHLR